MENRQLNIHNKTIESVKNGNARAMHTLYQQYSKAMFNVCIRMTNSREDAEDILQEAFTDAFQNINSYAYEASFGAWLKRIVVNKCINALKKQRVDLILTDIDYEVVTDEEVDYSMIELQVERVNQAITELPDGYKLVCTLYLIEGYDHKEIAQILNISESTSKSQYMRAKKKLKQIIVNYG